MRIVITGCTNNHIGVPHALKYVSTLALVTEGPRAGWPARGALARGCSGRRAAANATTGRSSFTSTLRPTNARHIYGALWTLLEFPEALVAIDDWTLGRIFGNTRPVMRNPKLPTEPSLLSPLHRDEARPYMDRLVAKVADLAAGSGHRIVPPLFPWGERARLGALPNLDLLRWYHPSPLVTPLYRRLDRWPEAKCERRWVLGALTKQVEWLDKQRLSWPVELYGQSRAASAAKGNASCGSGLTMRVLRAVSFILKIAIVLKAPGIISPKVC